MPKVTYAIKVRAGDTDSHLSNSSSSLLTWPVFPWHKVNSTKAMTEFFIPICYFMTQKKNLLSSGCLCKLLKMLLPSEVRNEKYLSQLISLLEDITLSLNAKDCFLAGQAGYLDAALYLILQKITFQRRINASQWWCELSYK